ncbi:Diadenosine hexaphosphate hydrolase [Rosistilla carotiformis]|uniref:Bis(5'-nucleosyl)-tetraphosphatase [asymmetrical] n=1 Tax=Rosistilla carotiformis TaxID=2528017 RepID=A0A518JMJ8_9BACT|nr:NUDIX domain-containing protein [Rosistilla carotiformis]QDV66786.1 Diadenosine hexaphosphate hydrolase [Rosistilla carotiformis]
MIQAAGYLVFRDHPRRQFLLMRHADRWDLPKGHVDDGESILQTARRELWEETGIGANDFVHDKDFLFQIQYRVKGRKSGKPRDKRVSIFLAQLTSDVEIVPTEHPGFEWFDWAPPHQIQPQTIDPLLAYAEAFFDQHNATQR